eukprot:5825333-Alexandrium_andersonii.AAC.1
MEAEMGTELGTEMETGMEEGCTERKQPAGTAKWKANQLSNWPPRRSCKGPTAQAHPEPEDATCTQPPDRPVGEPL